MPGTGAGSRDEARGSDARGNGENNAPSGAHIPVPVTLGDLLEHCCGIGVDAAAAGGPVLEIGEGGAVEARIAGNGCPTARKSGAF